MTRQDYAEYGELISLELMIKKKIKELGSPYKENIDAGKKISNTLMNRVGQAYKDALLEIEDAKGDI